MRNKLIIIFWLVSVFLALVSCKPSVEITTDYDRRADFHSYHSFRLHDEVKTRQVNTLNVDRVAYYISAELTRKGLKERSQQADLLVNAVAIIHNKRGVSANTNGYGSVYRPYYWGAMGSSSAHTNVKSYEYKAGTLTIDIIDAHTKKLVWQGSAKAEFDKQPRDAEKAIAETVAKILATYPIHSNNK